MLEQAARLITALPETYQLVLSLRYLEELNFPEIAEVLNLPEEEVRTIHFKSVGAVADLLNKTQIYS